MTVPPPNTALIIVDVQNDFCEGGALAVNGGNEVAEGIAEWVRDGHTGYALIVATRDWHQPQSDNGRHFAATGTDPDYADTWPAHCVQGTPGADYHPAIAAIEPLIDVHIVKGDGEPAYSGFQGRIPGTTGDAGTLHAVLRDNNITDVHIAGIATDYCVKATALDAAPHYTTTIIGDLCAHVALPTRDAAMTDMLTAGVTLGITRTTVDRLSML